MEINDFMTNFAEALDDIDAAELTPETRFRELDEWSSLSALSIQAMVDEEYDIQFKATEMKNTDTIKELFNLVKSYKE